MPICRQAQQKSVVDKMGRPRKETATTNAERCKKYREKNREAYRANDALRKQLARQRMKQNPHQRQLILKREAAAKREQRLRNKLFEQNGIFFLVTDFYLASYDAH